MRWLRFEYNGKTVYGVASGDTIEVTDATWCDILAGKTGTVTDSVDRGSVDLLCPMDRPGKIVAIGLNYLDHCRETNTPASRPTRHLHQIHHQHRRPRRRYRLESPAHRRGRLRSRAGRHHRQDRPPCQPRRRPRLRRRLHLLQRRQRPRPSAWRPPMDPRQEPRHLLPHWACLHHRRRGARSSGSRYPLPPQR